MAEALAVVGVVASIVQLVQFSSVVSARLNEFQSKLGEIPKSLRHIKAELPILQDTLQQTRKAIDAGSVGYDTERALMPAIEGCREQIKLLDDILVKIIPTSNDSWGERSKKALSSLHKDSKIENITKILKSYIGTLTFYYAFVSSNLQPLKGSTDLERV
jgi:hypothetical protein